MYITINNKELELADGATLGEVLRQQGLEMPGIAVAVDGRVVTRDAREAFVLYNGAKVLIIKAACGG